MNSNSSSFTFSKDCLLACSFSKEGLLFYPLEKVLGPLTDCFLELTETKDEHSLFVSSILCGATESR